MTSRSTICSFPSTYLAIMLIFFFFLNDPSTTQIYTLSLHDALPISAPKNQRNELPLPPLHPHPQLPLLWILWISQLIDRKSTRLNSSHTVISYAVFCLKKKKKKKRIY